MFAILAYITPTFSILNHVRTSGKVALTDSHCAGVTSLETEENNYLPMIVKRYLDLYLVIGFTIVP